MGRAEWLLKGTLLALGTTAVLRIVGLIRSALIARMLGVADFGIYGLFAVIVDIALISGAVGLPQALVRQLSGVTPDMVEERRRIFGTGLAAVGGLGLLISLVLVISAPFLADFYSSPELFFLVFLSGSVASLSMITGLFSMALLGLGEVKAMSLLGAILSLVSLPVLVIATYLGGLYGLAIGNLILIIVMFLLSAAYVRPYLVKHGIRRWTGFSWPRFKSMLSYGSPLVVSSLIHRPVQLFTASLVLFWLDPFQLGYYRVGYLILLMVLALPSALSVPLFPLLSGSGLRDDQALITTRVARSIALILAPLLVLIELFAPEFLGLVYGPGFVPAAPFLALILVPVPFMAVGSIILTHLYSTDRTIWFLVLDLAQSGALILGMILLIPRFGIDGVGFAHVIVFPVVVSILLLALSKGDGMEIRSMAIPLGIATGITMVGMVTVRWIDPILPRLIIGACLLVVWFYLATTVTSQEDRRLVTKLVRTIRERGVIAFLWSEDRLR